VKRYGRKTCRDRHDFLLPSQRNTTLGLVVGLLLAILSDPRHFYHPRVATPSAQLALRQLQDKSIRALAAMGQPIRTPGSYGAANQNAPFNDLITLSTNQSAPFPRLGHASDASGRMEGVCLTPHNSPYTTNLKYLIDKRVPIKFKVRVLIEVRELSMKLPIYVVNMKDDLLGNDFLSAMNLKETLASFFGISSQRKEEDSIWSRIMREANRVSQFLKKLFERETRFK